MYQQISRFDCCSDPGSLRDRADPDWLATGVSRCSRALFLTYDGQTSSAQAAKEDDVNSDGMNPASRGPLTLQEINEQNHRFWSVRSGICERRACDESLCDVAIESLHSEIIRGVPMMSQKSFDQALADAEMAEKTFHSAYSRKGGSAPRCDALQTLIEVIAAESPKITPGQLWRELNGDRGAGTISSIDEESDVKADEPKMIHFVDDDETPKRAPLSGLKDRLYRAKRKLASR
jgi:hypothetical protein